MRLVVANPDVVVPDVGLPVVRRTSSEQVDPGLAGYAFVQRCWDGSEVIRQGPLTAADIAAIPDCAPNPVEVNAATLRQRSQAALTNNATYLALASSTTTQDKAQVKALTRQVDGVIRLLLNLLDSVADS